MSLPRYPTYKDSGVEWLGEVPVGWGVKPLKRNLRLITEKSDRRDHPVALENIESWTGRFIPTETEFQGEGVAFAAGDILFGKLRPYLAKAYRAESTGEAVGDFHVMRPRSGIDSRFAQYQILNREFIAIVDGSTFGSKMPRASWEFVGEMRVTTPPLGEQAHIAAFLDRETAKIDALVAEQQRLIELLKEKRQAVISHAVTKGMNPDAPMKDSGIEWLGEVPAHWEVFKLRRCLAEHRQGYYSSEEYVDDGVKLLRITDLRPHGRVEFGDCPRVEEVPGIEPFALLPGDFVFARTGGAGLFGLIEEVPGLAVYASYLIRFRFLQVVNPRFLRHYLLSSSFQVAVRQHIHGGVNQNIHAEDIKNQYVALPPMTEQAGIASYLDIASAKIESLTAEAHHAIDLLQERRTALISAAVTGQIDVRPTAERASA